MEKKDIGLKEIAYELKLSINTVSRALRDCKDISSATKAKVREKAIELGYLQSSLSKLSYSQKKLIAIATSEFNNTYFSIACEVLFSLIEKEDNYTSTIIFIKSPFDVESMKKCISQRVDGIISLLEFSEEAVEMAKLNNIPLVLLGFPSKFDYVKYVRTDDKFGGELVANYLSNCLGIEKFIYISFGDFIINRLRRYSFFNKVYEINKNALIKEIQIEELDSEEMVNNIISLINDGYYGVFCYNDSFAYSLLAKLSKRIPNIMQTYPRLYIVGYDALCTKVLGFVDLASVQYNYNDFGNAAIEYIKAFFENKDYTAPLIPVKLKQLKK